MFCFCTHPYIPRPPQFQETISIGNWWLTFQCPYFKTTRASLSLRRHLVSRPILWLNFFQQGRHRTVAQLNLETQGKGQSLYPAECWFPSDTREQQKCYNRKIFTYQVDVMDAEDRNLAFFSIIRGKQKPQEHTQGQDPAGTLDPACLLHLLLSLFGGRGGGTAFKTQAVPLWTHVETCLWSGSLYRTMNEPGHCLLPLGIWIGIWKGNVNSVGNISGSVSHLFLVLIP